MFKKILPQDYPGCEEIIGDQNLINCANNCLKYLGKIDSSRWHPYWVDGRQVYLSELKSSLRAFIELYKNCSTPEQLRSQILKKFNLYQYTTEAGNTKVLITSYYSPTLKASRVRTGEYKYPLYSIPSDLVVFDSKYFSGRMNREYVECMKQDNHLYPYKYGEKVRVYINDAQWTWTGGKIVGRISGGELIPYYSRKDIDVNGVLDKYHLASPIAWLKSIADLMDVHIQGSATLQFIDGTKAFIYAVYTNALPFKNYVNETANLKGIQNNKSFINQYLEEHPGEAMSLLSLNPRYVFFGCKEINDNNTDLSDTKSRLVPFRSLAVDSRYVPLGGFGLIKGKFHISNDNNKSDFRNCSMFVFCQDIGGAVKGMHVDYYVGYDLKSIMYDNGGSFFLLLLKK